MDVDGSVAESPVHPVLAAAEAEAREILLEHEVYALLAGAGIRVPEHRVVGSPEEVDAALCREIGTEEAVVKVVSPRIVHKSDVGGVAVVRNTPGALRDAVVSVMSAPAGRVDPADIRGALIVRKVPFRPGLGREILAGFRHDRAFGPVVFAGVGGLDTEYLLRALAPGVAGILRSPAGLGGLDEALASLRGTAIHAALCGGLRSAARADVDEETLARWLLALASLADRLAGFSPPGGLGLSELEVNPFVAAEGSGRLVALDGLARLHRPAPLPAARPLASLRKLLMPTSAVVIGASSETVNPGRIILRTIQRDGGVPPDRVWALHPRAVEIDGCRAYSAMSSLPEVPDLAVVAVPADKGADRIVCEVVRHHLAHTVILIAGGFGETEAGREAERRMRDAVEHGHARPHGGVLVNGGNCIGIFSAPGRVSTFFLSPDLLHEAGAAPRNVAYLSQSGAFLGSQILCLEAGPKPRYAISFGNQVDLTVADYLEYLSEDPEVRVFAVYLEGFRRGDGSRFLETARRIVDGGRAVLLYKAGRTRAGRAAAASHTAAVVGDHEVCRDLARAAGVIDCESLDLFDDLTLAFSLLADRPPDGPRVAVLSNAGFECTAAADGLHGLELAELSPATVRRLRELLPGTVDVHNPIDSTPACRADAYAACVEAVLGDAGVDAVVVAGVPTTPPSSKAGGEAADACAPDSLPSRLLEVAARTRKPVVCSMDAGALFDPCARRMNAAGLPCYRKVDRAMRALGAFAALRTGERA